MSYITRTGNLVATPELREGEKSKYAYARIAVSDRVRVNGEWVDGPTEFYTVALSGRDAEAVVALAKASGNVRLVVSGELTTTGYQPEGVDEIRFEKNIRADEVGVSLRGQDVHVTLRRSQQQ